MRRTVVAFGLVGGVAAVAAGARAATARRLENHNDGTRVVAVHAGGGVVPANLLRVYIELSAPMDPGSAYDHIRLVDDAGREVRQAFLRIDEELWSPDRRRLTLLFDPGRVKRGIRSHDEMGMALVAGRQYRLVIDSAWRDANEHPLMSAFSYGLRVGPVDTTSPDPTRWTVSTPRAGTRDSLRVAFDKALDHALALRMIAVTNDAGVRARGHVALSDGDRVWTFVPDDVWSPSQHELSVDAALEDLAGNNIARPFDSDRRRQGQSAEAAVNGPARMRIPVPIR